MYSQLPRNDFIPNTSRGSQDMPNRKLCWQSHDDYYGCINDQIDKKREKINKYLCLDQMYMYETYCNAQFINMRRFRFHQDQMDKALWNEETLDLINYKKNSVTFEKNLPDNALFEDPELNNLNLFKSH